MWIYRFWTMLISKTVQTVGFQFEITCCRAGTIGWGCTVVYFMIRVDRPNHWYIQIVIDLQNGLTNAMWLWKEPLRLVCDLSTTSILGLMGQLLEWFEPSVALMPRGTRLLCWYIQYFSLSVLIVRPPSESGLAWMNSRSSIVTLSTLWLVYRNVPPHLWAPELWLRLVHWPNW